MQAGIGSYRFFSLSLSLSLSLSFSLYLYLLLVKSEKVRCLWAEGEFTRLASLRIRGPIRRSLRDPLTGRWTRACRDI